MTFKQAVRHGIENILDFRGTASRAQFWYWVLFQLLLTVALVIVTSWIQKPAIGGSVLSVADYVWSAANLVAGLSVLSRRLHDIGSSIRLLWIIVATVLLNLGYLGLSLSVLAAEQNNPFAAIPVLTIIPIGGLIVTLINVGVPLYFILLCIKPTKTYEQGNRFAQPTGSRYSHPSFGPQSFERI